MTRGALRPRGRATPTRGRAGVGHALQPSALAPAAGARSTLRRARTSVDARSFINDMSRNVMKTSAQARSRPARHRFVRGRRRYLFQPGRPGAPRSQSRRGARPLPRRQHDGARRRAPRKWPSPRATPATRSPRRAVTSATRSPRGAVSAGHKVAVKARDTTARADAKFGNGAEEGWPRRSVQPNGPEQHRRRTARSRKRTCGGRPAARRSRAPVR